MFQVLSSKSDVESLFKEEKEKEKEKEDHVLSHSSEEGGGGFITLADVKQKLGQTSDTIATRIAETSTLLMRGRTGKVKYIDPCERRILKLL
ncbi:hypothetical protein RFI_37673, partial [Reticulomyxa filosa]